MVFRPPKKCPTQKIPLQHWKINFNTTKKKSWTAFKDQKIALSIGRGFWTSTIKKKQPLLLISSNFTPKTSHSCQVHYILQARICFFCFRKPAETPLLNLCDRLTELWQLLFAPFLPGRRMGVGLKFHHLDIIPPCRESDLSATTDSENSESSSLKHHLDKKFLNNPHSHPFLPNQIQAVIFLQPNPSCNLSPTAMELLDPPLLLQDLRPNHCYLRPAQGQLPVVAAFVVRWEKKRWVAGWSRHLWKVWCFSFEGCFPDHQDLVWWFDLMTWFDELIWWIDRCLFIIVPVDVFFPNFIGKVWCFNVCPEIKKHFSEVKRHTGKLLERKKSGNPLLQGLISW